MDLCDRREIQALLERHGFHFSKAMGQNFLIEGWVPRDIADASGADERTGVLEIGPGIGPLTAQLVRRAAQVASVELDAVSYTHLDVYKRQLLLRCQVRAGHSRRPRSGGLHGGAWPRHCSGRPSGYRG